MTTNGKREALLTLQSLFLEANYVSFDNMMEATGITIDDIIRLKSELQEVLRSGDRTISLTSLNDGFFLDVG